MKTVKIGSIGLGRLGVQHAKNIAQKIAGAELTALCDVDEAKLQSVVHELNVKKTYTDFEKMAKDEELDALVIVSPSAFHPKQIEIGLDCGKHVFSEKPLGFTVQECRQAEKAVERHNDKVFMLAFMRRYDPSYQYALEKVQAGEIGKPILFRSYSQDPETAIKGAVAFGPHSGGLFFDMMVHDIDLARIFLQSEPEAVWSAGDCYAHSEFKGWNDIDNGASFLKFKNGSTAFLFAGRTAPHGYNVETEIIGTQGILRIGSVPQKNLVEVLDTHGVRKECSQNFAERFETAYLQELEEFVSCINEKRKPSVTVYDGTRVVEIADGCRIAFETGKLFTF